MNAKIWTGRAAVGTLAILFCTAITIGFSTKAEATLKHPPCSGCNAPVPYSQSYSWGSIYGSSNNGIVSTNVAPIGYTTVPVTINANEGVSTNNLPHATLQVSAVTLASGQEAYELYVYTKSAYAPNGDSGSFTFSTSGQLIGGDSSGTLSRLRSEVEDADPAAFSSIGAIPQGFWSSLEGDLQCAGAAAVDAAAGLALLDPATAPAAGGIIFGAGGWRILARATSAAC